MPHTKHQHANCWSRTPRYQPGGKLTAEQLNASQSDATLRDRLVNIAMHGVGVAYGFQIKTDKSRNLIVENGCIDISCGLAFDKYGRMLFWPGGQLHMDQIIGHKPTTEDEYTLSAHYAEALDPSGVFDPCYEGTDWVDRCVVFTLTRECPKHDSCAPDVPTDECMTRDEWICSRNGFEQGDVAPDKELKLACSEVPTLATSDCGRVNYEPGAGIALSCVKICDVDKDKTDCIPRYDFCHLTKVDNCSVRPVAYRSRLLYELLNKDDVPLAKIERYSWSKWELQEWSNKSRVSFSEFRSRAEACHQQTINPDDGFSLMFTRPVMRRTLHPLSIIMDIYILATKANYWEPWRIPSQVIPLNKNARLLIRNQMNSSHGALCYFQR